MHTEEGCSLGPNVLPWNALLLKREGLFTNSQQHKNVNIAKFVFAVPLKINLTNEVCNFENVIFLYPLISNFTFTNIIVQIKKELKICENNYCQFCVFVKNPRVANKR